MKTIEKPLLWNRHAKSSFDTFPKPVKQDMGYALYLAQLGQKHKRTKPLKGFGGAGVLEVVEQYEGNAYRTVYTLRFEEAVFVLHAFQKKSKRGIETPKQELDLIKRRLKTAEDDYQQWKATQ